MQVRAFQTEGKAEQINGVRRFASPGLGPKPRARPKSAERNLTAKPRGRNF